MRRERALKIVLVLVRLFVYAVIAAQEYRNVNERRELAGVVVFAIVGVVLAGLAPAKQSVEKASAVVA